MPLDITTPDGSFEAKLLQEHFSKDSQFKWSTSKDVQEAEARTASGEIIKGVGNIVRHLINASAPDSQSPLDLWTRKTLNVDEVVDHAELVNHHLQLRTFISGHYLSLADIVVRDNFKRAPKWSDVNSGKTTPHLLRWIAHLDSLPQLGGKISKIKSEEPTKGIAGWHGTYDASRLPGASEGNVVTRFPPEPSGYLHIGHIKAAMLNSFYATMYKGRLILRFDDTNPAKEKDDFVDNIKDDLAQIGITFQSVSYTSDYFDTIEKYAVQLLKSGKAFIDDTPLEQMRAERRTAEGTEGVDSKCRNQTVEENLKLFDEMRAGSPNGLKCVMRAKIDMKSKNGVMRDPSLYRCSVEPHYKVGTKYKAYPLYDFACPIVDSIEGVTHALRSSEYHDRNPLYVWVLEALGLRKPHIEDFSRLNFKYVLLSKRKLQKFVDSGRVAGWDDPRFPTVQGILRRGMTVQALREFIFAQGASKALNLMDMDKLWAINKQIIDSVVPRYTVVDSSRVPLKLTNSPGEPTFKSIPRHKKNNDLGNKVVMFHNQLSDAKQIKDNEEITLMDWGNAIIKTITRDASGNVTALEGELNLQGDFKSTEKKVTWLADTPDAVPVVLRKYGYLITKDKLEDLRNDNFEDFINPNSLHETTGYGDPALRTLNKGDKLQVERKGYYIVDSPFLYPNQPIVLILIPDGKAATSRQVSRDDPLVDISNLYTAMFNKDDIVEGYFMTCKSHKEQIEYQTIAYGALSHENAFWSFVTDTKRVATSPRHHQIEDFVRLGVPPNLRSRLWPALAGVNITPAHVKQYKELQMQQPEDFVVQIALDVTRTFATINDPVFTQRLSRVLIAYANHNPSLGYCQSMNILAGTLLLFMEEEHAFWMLVYMVEELLTNYHSLTMSGFIADAELFQWLVADNLPELHKHFQSLHCDIVALTAPWFLSLYVHEMPIVTALLVWDNIMLEGTHAVFEVGLALLRMQQEELLQYDSEVDVVVHIRKHTKELYNPKKLLAHWKKLDTERVDMAKRTIRQRSEEDASRVAIINVQFSEIAMGTHYLKNLWYQYTVIFPFLCSSGTTGLDFKQFSQFVGGTFSEWWVDRDLVERLFSIADVNKDDIVDFHELVSLLSLMCRGTFDELVLLNFRLFDVKGKGAIDRFDLARMLQSMYGTFRHDERFTILLRNFVNNIFDFPMISHSGTITIDTFQYVVLVQPQILERFTTRNPKLKYNQKNTYFYWMDMDRPHRTTELIHIALDQQAHMKQAHVPLPTVFGSLYFAVH